MNVNIRMLVAEIVGLFLVFALAVFLLLALSTGLQDGVSWSYSLDSLLS